MSGFINIDPEIIAQHSGIEIEYYALWDVTSDTFFAGKSFIHGIYSDNNGQLKIYSDLIWGQTLDNAYLSTEFDIYCIEEDIPIFLGPTPFAIFRVDYEGEFGEPKVKYVPAESEMDLQLTCELFTKKPYKALRVNLDLTTYINA